MTKQYNKWNLLTVLSLLVFALLQFAGCDQGLGDGEILYDGPEPPATMVTLEKNGEYYEVYAAEGQVIVMFDESVPHDKAVKILRKNRAKVIAQMPDIQYYLVEVPVGKEGEFVSKMSRIIEVEYVFPNAYEKACSAVPYVFDNFNVDHGDMVTSMVKGDFPLMNVNCIDIGRGKKYVDSHKSNRNFKSIVKALEENESAVINFSFGPALKQERERALWNDADVTTHNQSTYIYLYLSRLEEYVKIAKRFNNKDFVVTLSSGNEGMKSLEGLLVVLRSSLSQKEYAVLEHHFILVSAKDDNKECDYPNDVSSGHYDKMVTKVDISDKTAKSLDWQGTSFSSPRAAGYITAIANEYDMKVVDVLKYARKATEYHPEHLLEKEHVEEMIRNDLFEIQEITIDGVLNMYLLDNMGGPDVIYYYDEDGNCIGVDFEDQPEYPFMRKIISYQTPNEHEYLAFVLESDKLINVKKHLSKEEAEFQIEPLQSSFNLFPYFSYSDKDFAAKYANKHVRVKGSLYVPIGGWRCATTVTMNLLSIELLDQDNQAKPSDEELSTNNPEYYDYSFTIPYSLDLFRSEEDLGGEYRLSNGDVLEYHYYYSYGFGIYYFIRFTLKNGGYINSKYQIAAAESLDLDFKDLKYVESKYDDQIDVSCGMFSFTPIEGDRLVILVKKR